MPRPNFFILGAPKCGTTSLASWLGEHPKIYMSPTKEPHFFNTDDKHPGVPTQALYEQLFSGAQASHQAIGEASVWYLYSQTAVTNIEAYSRDARYVVCLRNPTEMAYSLHEQQVVNGIEHITNFQDAWHQSEARMRGESVTRVCQEPQHLAYQTVCKLGTQLERLLNSVERERVLPLLLDDLREAPRQEYLRVLRFLQIEDDGRTTFEVHNTAKERRWPLLQRAILVVGGVKRRLGIQQGLGILSGLDRKNLRHRPRLPMGPSMRKELQSHFQPDIKRLSGLLGRDLSHWLT